MRIGAQDGSEAGARVSGVKGMPVPKQISVDFLAGGACTPEGGLQLIIATSDGATTTLDCRTGRVAPSPVTGAKGWMRVSWKLGDPFPDLTLVDLIFRLPPARKLDSFITIGSLPEFTREFGWPGLSVYVTDDRGGRVVRLGDIAADGGVSTAQSFGTSGNDVGQFNAPTDVWVDDAGWIYVTDPNTFRLIRFDDMSGAGWIELTTECPPRICGLQSVVGDGGGGLFAYGFAEGVFRASLTAPPVLLGLVPISQTSPNGYHDAFPDGLGRIYVTHDDDKLWRFDNDRGSGAVSLALATGGSDRSLFVDGRNRIYVSDKCHLTRFDDMTGAGKVSFPSTNCPTTVDGGPSGAALDAYGRIYFAQTINGIGEVYRMNAMDGSGLVRLASFPGSSLTSIWVDER